jgi:AcrR family transcriptional regulator
LGYNGVSTRDIARAAKVNETSIYRYYPGKRELFIATLDAEFSKLRFRSDLISKLAAAPDAHAAHLALFQVIMQAALQQPSLVRLVHFSVLEYSEDLDDLYRRHAQWILKAASDYLARWPDLIEMQGSDSRTTIFAFVATFVALKDFYPIVTGERLSMEFLEKTACICADRWHAALAENPAKSGPLLGVVHV